MLHVVYINHVGFIDTFDKTTKSYTTTKNIDVADFSGTFEEAQSTAEFFNGVVLSMKEEEN